MDIGIRNVEKWNEEWISYFDHYQQDLRHAYYIRAILNENEKKILEIGAGSFRDIGLLSQWGYSCSGIDYSEESVFRAKKYFEGTSLNICSMDAFDMSFNDNSFDFSYHNGFWPYFNDEEIKKLIEEQARVTKYRIVATVHNKHNHQFVDYFEHLSEKDPLYRLRFFEMDEISELMYTVCKNVKVIPVGKGKKLYEDDLINIGLGDAQYIKRSFDYHDKKLLPISERLMCVGIL